MSKDVTLGRYYPKKGLLHYLDPRVKLFGLLLYVVSLFMFNSWLGFCCCLFFLVLIILLSEVPFFQIIKGLKAVITVLIFATALNALLGKGGWVKTLFITFRMIAIVLSSNILTLTTRPREISNGLEKSLSFLNYIHIPVHDFATIISLAFRFIPILSEEAERIMDAQKSRGAKMGEGKIKDKAKAILPITIPLFVSAFRRSDELSEAMDSRLYGCGKRTVWKEMKYSKRDIFAYIFLILFLLLIVAVRFLPCP